MVHQQPAPAPIERVTVVLVALLVFTSPYIDLEVAVPVGRWQANAPIADLAALAVFLLAGPWVVRRPWPAGALAYGVLLLTGFISALGASDVASALHELVRKPLFYGVAYGLGLTGVVAGLRNPEWLRRALLVSVAVCAGVSLFTSSGRILAGDTLWFHTIDGLTNNHKTLAVAMVPALALLWGWPGVARSRLTTFVVLAGTVALAASVSRTAWITFAVAATCFVSWGGKRLSERRGLLPVVVIVGVLAATYGPLLTRSIAQSDALRSRHSLDKRSWRLFVSEPLIGAGPGESVRVEVAKWPDYRVNGVDAHGVVQKVGAEYGLLGLVAYGAFVWATGRRVRARDRAGDGRWPAYLALHTNLLFSTETFSPTHWTIFALVMGLTERDGEAAPG